MLQKRINEHQRRSLAHIIRARLESKPPHRNALTLQLRHGSFQLLERNSLLLFIHRLHSLQNAHMVTQIRTAADKCFHVLREAGATIATTGIKEFLTDAVICANSPAHGIHIGAHKLAEVGNVVHERNARSQHAVGSVLNHLRTGDIAHLHTVADKGERTVQLAQHTRGLLILHPHDNAVGSHEILNSGSLFQELRVARHSKGHIHAAFIKLLLHGGLQPEPGTHRHRTLGNKQRVLLDKAAELTSHLQHIAQIGRTILIRRGSHSAEHHIHIVYAFCQAR